MLRFTCKRRKFFHQKNALKSGVCHSLSLEIITATNLNAKYLTCVPSFIDFWKLIDAESSFAFTPRVVVIAEEYPSALVGFEEYCQVVSPGRNHTALVAQLARLVYAADSDKDLVMTSDIDMLPLSSHVTDFALHEMLKRTTDLAIVRDVLGIGQFPVCYTIASPEKWTDIVMSTGASHVDRITEIAAEFVKAYEGSHGGPGWFTDQEFLWDRVNALENSGASVLRLADDQTGHLRLDRVLHRFPLNWLLLPFVRYGIFSDYHVHHPISRNHRFISALKTVTRQRIESGQKRFRET